MPTCASGSMRSRARHASAVPARCWSAARWSRNTRSAAPHGGPLYRISSRAMLAWLIDFILHLDRHLVELLTRFDLWIYPILFAVIFAAGGLLVAPLLPGGLA